MNYQREIAKWVERKSKLGKGKRGGRYVLLRFKRAVRESLWGELLCKVGLDGGVASPAPHAVGTIMRGMGDDSLGSLSLPRDPPKESTSKDRLPKECLPKECPPKTLLLKRTVQNFHNVRRLLGRNDPVYADLARAFSRELQGREGDTLNRLDGQPNGRSGRYDQAEHLQRGSDTIDVADLMHLFIFYTSIEWHRFGFLIQILRCITRVGSTASSNQETCAKFLKSCVNLRIEIKKKLKTKKGGPIFRLHRGTTHWGKSHPFTLMPNGVPPIRGSPHQVKRLIGRPSPKWRHSPKRLQNRSNLQKRGRNALRPLPPGGRRSYHVEETYAKWEKRTFKLEMVLCNGLIEECAYLILGKGGHLDDAIMKYVKVLRRGGIYLNRGDSSNSFTSQLAYYVNANCECLPPDELLIAVDYLTEARKEAKRGTGVDPQIGRIKLTRALTRMSQHLCSAIQKGSNEYTAGEVSKVLALCVRNKRYDGNHYDENLLEGVISYAVEHLDQISSRRLTRLAINIHQKMGYPRNGLLQAIVNRYRPPFRRGASRGGRGRTDRTRRRGERADTSRRERANTPPLETTDGPSWEGNPPRRNFQSVRISQLLRFLKVLIQNDLHLDEQWADYFLSLIKRKFAHISRGDFPLLCHVLLHVQSREILPSFFTPSGRYHLYRYFPIEELAKSLRLTPLIQVLLLLSTQIHPHNRRIFFFLFFNTLRKFCLQSGPPHESAHGERPNRGGDSTCMSSPPQIEKDQRGENEKQELSFFKHNLNFYERGNNNKYGKKKKKKKKQLLQNKIAKAPIPTCEQVKEEIIPFIKLAPPDCEREVILDAANRLSSTQGGETTCVYTVTTPGGAAPPDQQNSVKENCPTRVTSPLGGDPPGETNHPHFVITCNGVANGRGLPRQTHLRENNAPSASGGRTDPPYGNPPMKKQTDHKSDYFESVANARNVLLAIQTVLLHLAEEPPNGSLEDASSSRRLSSRLSELTLTQLFLLHRTYALCCAYIDSSLSEQRSLNNERVVSSSRLHKQVLSVLAHVTPQEEVTSELVHHPFQVDICLRRRPC
ncbi:unnamed protein product [Plasmodium vivax]|uniref:Uncharacterized protein n=3 Tax=Plasmodium vivax TaxID=5855 RepID=A5KBW3_PLAVS|nr:hypothetical protein PVX_002735 [Plasmodium vivax]KMZ94727.1 hypothetical protein PVMG_02616 [Plasmodium vivax Mauritania I]EDL43159.1 hypothetical protein PVX_002735 [Plasmodium vivax]CAG9482426.1 unnamed protein product [Plasmodium vivax]CAI7718449.1 conserved Plasmodium protein, unknown function [Plasmodium vivax]VUZ93740.1 conserved Plasmodium protein, unknown function [Plasmodium vivax]|eukprot:XP_001612886.1 hypothetical protein [Plasmodium vivax Sal-1]